MDRLNKQPAETIDFTFDFADALATGDTINTGVAPTVTLVNVNGTVTGDVLPTLGTKTANTTGVKQRVSGGTDGQTYKLTCVVTTTAGEVLEHEFKLKVKDA